MTRTSSWGYAIDRALEEIAVEAARKGDFRLAAILVEQRCGFCADLRELVVEKLNAEAKKKRGAPRGRGKMSDASLVEETLYRLSRKRADGLLKKTAKSLVAEELKLTATDIDRIIRMGKNSKKDTNIRMLYDIFDDPAIVGINK